MIIIKKKTIYLSNILQSLLLDIKCKYQISKGLHRIKKNNFPIKLKLKLLSIILQKVHMHTFFGEKKTF